MYNLSCDYALKVKEKNAEILKEASISGKSSKALFMITYPYDLALVEIKTLSWSHLTFEFSYGLALSLVGERNLVAGNASGEEFFLTSLAGAGRGGENF